MDHIEGEEGAVSHQEERRGVPEVGALRLFLLMHLELVRVVRLESYGWGAGEESSSIRWDRLEVRQWETGGISGGVIRGVIWDL